MSGIIILIISTITLSSCMYIGLQGSINRTYRSNTLRPYGNI